MCVPCLFASPFRFFSPPGKKLNSAKNDHLVEKFFSDHNRQANVFPAEHNTPRSNERQGTLGMHEYGPGANSARGTAWVGHARAIALKLARFFAASDRPGARLGVILACVRALNAEPGAQAWPRSRGLQKRMRRGTSQTCRARTAECIVAVQREKTPGEEARTTLPVPRTYNSFGDSSTKIALLHGLRATHKMNGGDGSVHGVLSCARPGFLRPFCVASWRARATKKRRGSSK